MAPQERTPLLSRRGLPLHNRAQDLPIFLQVCHSDWNWLTQGALVLFRGLIFAYLTGLGPALGKYQLKLEANGDSHSPWSILFDFPTVSYSLYWLFHLIAFLWSLMHSWIPVLEPGDGHWKVRVASKLSPPEPPACSRKPLYFSLFYTAAHVFNFLNTLIYWAVLVPKGHGNFPGGGGDPVVVSSAAGFFGHGWFEPFSIINLYGVTSLISSAEIMFLNSIKPHDSIWKHILAIVLLLAGYLGWGGIGKVITGHYPFFWMNPAEVGKVGVAVYGTGFVSLGLIAFAVVHSLTVLREKLLNRGSQREQYEPINDSDDASGGQAAGSRA